MTTPLGTISYFTDEEMMVQSDTELLGSTVESLTVEFNQERYEKFLSSGSINPKSSQKFRKVSNETTLSFSSEGESSDEDRHKSFKKMRRSSPTEVSKAMPGQHSNTKLSFKDSNA